MSSNIFIYLKKILDNIIFRKRECIKIEYTFTRDHTVVCTGDDVCSRLVVSAYVWSRSPKCRYVALNDDDSCLLHSRGRL